MLRKTGSSVGFNGAAVGLNAAEAAPGPAARPWASGSVEVEALLAWAYQDQKAGGSPTDGLSEVEAVSEGLVWYGSSTCGCAAVERIGLLNARVDVSGPGRRDVHPVADAVVATLEGSELFRQVLRSWARSGARPGGWAKPARWCEPVHGWVRVGLEATAIYESAGGVGGGARQVTPVLFRGPDAVAVEMEAGRDQYRAWRAAMDDLAWALNGLNLGFAVLPPAAPAEPWRADEALAAGDMVALRDGPVLFVAGWCALSRSVLASLAELEAEARVTVVDIDLHPELAVASDVRGVPTAGVMVAGAVGSLSVGMMRKPALARWLAKAAAVSS
jgi:thiol-disulfide isomerase/thioredoxin